jgi:hypothetical protein
MFIDANDLISADAISADVCIVGSGPAGLALARTLVELNKTVVFVEKGGRFSTKPPMRDVLYKSDKYDGINNGVAFGFGGTGVLWGGQLLPMLDNELAQLGPPWSEPEFTESLFKHNQIIEQWVGVSLSTYYSSLLTDINHAANSINWNGFLPLFSKWIPFRMRDLGKAWAKILRNSNKVRVLLNLQPKKVEFSEDNRDDIKSLRCCSANGHIVNVEAKIFVFAGGALETPLVLEKLLGIEVSSRLKVGQYLHDHLSVRMAEITNYSREEYERFFAPFFTGLTMRSIRLCLPNQGGNSNIKNWAYCHFVVEAPENSGFAIVRDILRGLQAKNYPMVIKASVKLPMAIGDILRMLWMRYVKRSLAVSSNSRIFVNLDFVKIPLPTNSIHLKGEKSDEIVLDWTIDENLQQHIDLAFELFSSFWKENNLHKIGNLEKVIHQANQANALENMYDIYHPAGTCAIGRVVDSDLRILGLSNGFVTGSAVFPQLGRSNPTLTIMALSRRLGIALAGLLN